MKEEPQVNRQALDSEPKNDDPRDDGGGGSNSGSYGVAIFGLIVTYLVVASIIGWAMSNNNPPPAATPTCTSACYGFVKLECPGNRFMGPCFDVPWCSGTPHVCGKDN